MQCVILVRGRKRTNRGHQKDTLETGCHTAGVKLAENSAVSAWKGRHKNSFWVKLRTGVSCADSEGGSPGPGAGGGGGVNGRCNGKQLFKPGGLINELYGTVSKKNIPGENC